MNSNRQIGQTYLYLDEKNSDFSNIAAGLLIRTIGERKKIAYIDSKDSASKLTNFIENLSLSYSFVKKLGNFALDIYKIKPNNKISKTLIPQVEFGTITTEMFWNSLSNYDLIIFDNLTLETINIIKLISTLQNKSPFTNIIAITPDKKTHSKLKENFQNNLTCNHIEHKNLNTKKGITNITGEGVGKTLYSIGYLIRNFIYKKDVKLIYFDKGDDIYGDPIFLTALKKWSMENNYYGTFDFVKTGIKRFNQTGYREFNSEIDTKEAKDALMLLETSLKKQTPVIADELNTIIEKNILSIKDVLPILNKITNEIIITGRQSPKEILNISEKIIEIN